MPVHDTGAHHMKRRFRKILPLAIAGASVIGVGVLAEGPSAQAACSISSNLHQGERNDQVRCLQSHLGIGADGWYGPQTRAAVVAYQSSHGLTVDGWVGRETGGSLGVWASGARAARQAPARQARTQRSSGGSTGASGVNWDNVARCESGGQWGHGTVTNHVGTFSGGLMIMNSAWRQFGGQEFAPTAGQASRGQQIIVAERIAARVGAARAWQCPVG